VVENATVSLLVRLNGELLGRVSGDEGAGRFDVTDRLLARNELTLVNGPVSTPSDEIRPSPPAEVCLEIAGDM
jgi:hypothetical protein